MEKFPEVGDVLLNFEEPASEEVSLLSRSGGRGHEVARSNSSDDIMRGESGKIFVISKGTDGSTVEEISDVANGGAELLFIETSGLVSVEQGSLEGADDPFEDTTVVGREGRVETPLDSTMDVSPVVAGAVSDFVQIHCLKPGPEFPSRSMERGLVVRENQFRGSVDVREATEG